MQNDNAFTMLVFPDALGPNTPMDLRHFLLPRVNTLSDSSFVDAVEIRAASKSTVRVSLIE